MEMTSKTMPIQSAESLKERNTDSNKVQKDIVAGTCAGIASVLSGHPLE